MRRSGTTTLEQLVVLVMLALLALVAITSSAPLLSAAAVETATRDATALFALARDHALSAGERTAIHLDAPHHRLAVHVAGDTLAVADLAGRAVRLETTRDSMAYAPSGLGLGAANLRLVLSRGARSDTITVSRLGRVQIH
ncbi:GspH/FimT family protein [Gemmatimonas sp.]